MGVMPWAFLAVSLLGAAFTVNAWRPRRRQGVLVVPSFVAGWLTTEMAAHHLFWQAVATVAFVWAGALEAWPGWVGLGVTLASWVGLGALVRASRSVDAVVEPALTEALGPRYRDAIDPAVAARFERRAPRGRMILPFLLRDRAVTVTRNIRYAPGAGRRHLLDVYAPREGAHGAPVLLQVHGGGWTIGTKRDQALPLMLHLAARGWVCVAANYRLSPKATWPDHLVDLKLALRWIREHVHEHGGDPDFVVATGGSAGGHLATMVALTANDPEYQPGFEDVDTSVRACVPFYGIYDLTNTFGRAWGRRGDDGMGGFVERVVVKRRVADAPEIFEAMSPIHRVRPDAPPFLVIHGSQDSLAPVQEARVFVELLRNASRSPVVYLEIPVAQHAFEVLHSPRTRRVAAGVDRFLGWVWCRYRAGQAAPATGPAGAPDSAPSPAEGSPPVSRR